MAVFLGAPLSTLAAKPHGCVGRSPFLLRTISLPSPNLLRTLRHYFEGSEGQVRLTLVFYILLFVGWLVVGVFGEIVDELAGEAKFLFELAHTIAKELFGRKDIGHLDAIVGGKGEWTALT